MEVTEKMNNERRSDGLRNFNEPLAAIAFQQLEIDVQHLAVGARDFEKRQQDRSVAASLLPPLSPRIRASGYWTVLSRRSGRKA